MQKLGLRHVINAAGTMTVIGASAAVPEAVRAAADVLPLFVEIDDLQRHASAAIAAATGAEAGFVTAGASAGVTLSIAAAMTGNDLDLIARLPNPSGMQDGVAIQRGHLINYGAPLDQAVRLAGARVIPIGETKRAEPAQLEAALDDSTAAALYVVSHHTEQSGQIPLAVFVAICAGRRVPVIVDAASEYNLAEFIAASADIAIYSAHKFLGGLTAGIVAGRKELVRAAYLQNLGIGRGMKVGKEGIVGAIAALGAWSRRDHEAVRRSEEARVSFWMQRLSAIDGLRASLSPDPTGNPITRLRAHIEPAVARTTAWDIADMLAEGERPIMVRDDEIAEGFFELDPCNLSNDEAEEVATRLRAALASAKAKPRESTSFAEWTAKQRSVRLAWPDRAG